MTMESATRLVIMAGIAMLAIIPARRLPNFVPGEVPDPFANEARKGPIVIPERR
jgi:hypothetical protein